MPQDSCHPFVLWVNNVAKKSYTFFFIWQVIYFFQHFSIGTVVKKKTVNKIILHHRSQKILSWAWSKRICVSWRHRFECSSVSSVSRLSIPIFHYTGSLRWAEGFILNRCRYAVTKCSKLLNPQANATSVIDCPVVISKIFAWFNLTSLRYWCGEMFMTVLKIRLKWKGLTRQCSANCCREISWVKFSKI